MEWRSERENEIEEENEIKEAWFADGYHTDEFENIENFKECQDGCSAEC